MSTEQLKWIDQQIQARLSRMRELADLEKRSIGAAVGRPIPGKQDIEPVRSFLSNLGETWNNQPNGLKNALLRLLLDKVIIWSEPESIKAKLMWGTGLEQELMIRRLIKGDWQDWTETELAIVKEPYENSSQDELLAMLPARTWKAIKSKARQFGLHRKVRPQSTRDKYTPEEDELLRRYYASEINLSI